MAVHFSRLYENVLQKVKTEFEAYLSRITTDSGEIHKNNVVQAFYAFAERNGLYSSIQFAWLAETGAKKRTSTIYSYFTKLYNLLTTNDAAQTTEANQPRVTGNIAPGDVEGMMNQNGESRYVSHPEISYGASDPWSVTFIINTNSVEDLYFIFGGSTNSDLRYNSGLLRLFYAGTNDFISASTVYNTIGKNIIYTLVANGTSLKLYINGTLNNTVTGLSTTAFKFDQFNSGALTYFFKGNYYAHIIRSQALTAAEVLAEYNFLRGKYPEIPSVTIGTQTWALRNCDMVATPMGNVIQNITEGTNVEKVTNGGFTGNANGWGLESGWSYGTNNLVASSVTTGLVYQVNVLTINKWYKLQFDCVVSSGRVGVYLDGGTYVGLMITTGTSIAYFYNTNSSTYIYFRSPDNNFSGSIDNVSIQEVGWADSQNLYDYVYANTAGTAEQKTYAAVKAAAMWCFYNNSADNGAIYGKLYNWFAVKLLQMDIDYYNASNPSTPWGWHVPSSTEFTTLANALGGTSVAGGKMKLTGTDYWTTPNTGATNESGFSALGGGYNDPPIGGLKGSTYYYTQDVAVNCVYLTATLNELVSGTLYVTGISLRLIKD